MNERAMVGTELGRIAGRAREDASLRRGLRVFVWSEWESFTQKQGLLIHLLTGSFLTAERRRDWGIRVSDKVTRSSSTK